ncbi:MAG: winged helix-turn-helix transcriptional regulator, partial [Promethearchaeota archaeon]
MNENLIEDLDFSSKYMKIVIELIQDYLKKKRFFTYQDIIPFISSRLAKKSININYEGIKYILRSLVKKNYIRFGSKLTKDDIFTNLNRKDIYYYIKKNPGVYFYKIVKKLNLTISVVAWHLNILEEFDFIKKVRLNGNNGYFDSTIEIERRKVFNLISKEKSRKIIESITSNQKGITISKLSRELGMSRNTIKIYVRKMLDLNIVYFKIIGTKKLYLVNDSLLKMYIKTSIKRKKMYIDIPQAVPNLMNKIKSNK